MTTEQTPTGNEIEKNHYGAPQHERPSDDDANCYGEPEHETDPGDPQRAEYLGYEDSLRDDVPDDSRDGGGELTVASSRGQFLVIA